MENKTIKKTEIIDSISGDLIATIEGHLNFQSADSFYLSIREPHPRTIEKYMELNNNFPKTTLDSVVDEVKDKAILYHIAKFKVVESCLSLTVDHGFDVTNPIVTEVLSLTVVELND